MAADGLFETGRNLRRREFLIASAAAGLTVAGPINHVALARGEVEPAGERDDDDGARLISGDIHTFIAGNLTTTGEQSGTPVGTELVGGSVTSLGLPEETGFPASSLEALRQSADPHTDAAASEPRVEPRQVQGRVREAKYSQGLTKRGLARPPLPSMLS
jgi:hypothetical protein